MILSQIIQEKKKAIEEAKYKLPKDKIIKELGSFDQETSFIYRLTRTKFMNLIAEVKQASPSKGVLRRDFNPVKIAQTYYMNGADAISVLTEEKFFLGNIENISRIKQSVRIPILRKDFIIDEYQIYESKLYGADAILLIACLLSVEELAKFSDIAKKVGLDILFEVHNQEDLQKVLRVDAQLIGINNRNLNTFKVDLKTTAQMISKIPKGKIIVSESGIKTHEDMVYLKSLGVNIVLIGETFIKAENIGQKVRELTRF